MTEYTTTPPLALVACGLLRADPRLGPLHHVTALLTELLDASVVVTPAAAAASGSLRLFDRVQRRVARDQRIDTALRSHWLARALEAALRNDDLSMVQRVHAWHPRPLFVQALIATPTEDASTLALALRFGTLETLQWVAAHRRDRLCCPTGAHNLCVTCLLAALPNLGDKDPFRIFRWLVAEARMLPTTTQRDVSKLWPFMIRSVDVVRWLHERKLLSRPMGELVLGRVVEIGRADIVQFLLEAGCRIRGEKNITSKLIHAACFGHSDVVEVLLSSDHCRSFRHKFEWTARPGDDKKILRWTHTWMNERIRGGETTRDVIRLEASRAGNGRVLRWLHDEQGIVPSMWHVQNHVKTEEAVLEVFKWMHRAGVLVVGTEALDTACRDGLFNVVQWLHTHISATCTVSAMDDAAANGHLDVVRWLHVNRSEGCSRRALMDSARNGHLRVVQWLLANRGELHEYADEAKIHGAKGGHLDVLDWLCQAGGISCTLCLTKAALQSSRSTSPDVLRWLHTRNRRLCQDCLDAALHNPLDTSRSEAAIRAAVTGDLDLLKFLDTFNPSDCSSWWRPATLERIAQAGHVAVRQWIAEKLRGSGDAPIGFEERLDASDWRDARHDARTCSGGADASSTRISRHEIR